MKWCELREYKWNDYVTIAVNGNLSNCKNSPKKSFFGASTGFEPVASALALQCPPSRAMKTHILEVGQFIEFINSWKEWNTEWNDVNCGNTNEMTMWSSQFTSFHSVFHSFHGLMNSINWSASCRWVFIAQLGEHCSANALKPRKTFVRLFSQLLKLRFTAMVT